MNIILKNLDLDYMRSLIGYVPQEPVLFNESIKWNVEFGRKVDFVDVQRACEKNLC